MCFFVELCVFNSLQKNIVFISMCWNIKIVVVFNYIFNIGKKAATSCPSVCGIGKKM